ncbi:MAG: Rhomboid family protein [Thermoleophilia bacterium]|nr:Rhomboid family protein [Thermoleophilia bacterium]
MRARATDSGPADGWRGARIGAERRHSTSRARWRIDTEIDIGEPGMPVVTITFLLATALMTLVEFSQYGASPVADDLARAGGSGVGVIATGEWWKVLTSNLLHGSVPHLLFNAFAIYLTGRWLEHLAGRMVVATTMLWSAVIAGAGALFVDTPTVVTGASGVAFGLLGACVAVDPRARTPVGLIARQLVIFNVIGTFLLPGISIGGHLGGLAAGLAVGALAWRRTSNDAAPAGRPRPAATRVMFAAALPIIALLAVGPGVLPNEARDLRGSLTAPLLARQLDGAELTGGFEIDTSECERTDAPRVYACEITGDGQTLASTVEFEPVTHDWSLRFDTA